MQMLEDTNLNYIIRSTNETLIDFQVKLPPLIRQFGNLLYLLHLPGQRTNTSIHQQRNKHSPSAASLSARGPIGFSSCVWFNLLTPGVDGKAFCSHHQSAAVKGLSVSLMSFRIRSCFLSCVDTVTLTAASPRKLFTC